MAKRRSHVSPSKYSFVQETGVTSHHPARGMYIDITRGVSHLEIALCCLVRRPLLSLSIEFDQHGFVGQHNHRGHTIHNKYLFNPN